MASTARKCDRFRVAPDNRPVSAIEPMRADVAALIRVVAALVLAQTVSVSVPARIGSTNLMGQAEVTASAATHQGAVV